MDLAIFGEISVEITATPPKSTLLINCFVHLCTLATVKQEHLAGINFGEKPDFIQLADINFGEKQTSLFLLWRKADQHSVKF